MKAVRRKLAHIWDRDPLDWYVEPPSCSLALFVVETFRGPIWDPACGQGNIIKSARELNLATVASDIQPRNNFFAKRLDFFHSSISEYFHDIVSNPPFGIAEDFVLRSISLVPSGGKVAMLLPLVWMAGFSKKRSWLPSSPLKSVFPISPRPSMPPGAVLQAGEKPGNGTKDFAWFVWEMGYEGRPSVFFLDTNAVLKKPHRRRLAHESLKQRDFPY